MTGVVEDMIATGRNPDTAGQRTWPNWKVADALEAAQSEIAALRERVGELEGTVRSLIALAIDGGLTHDLVAQLYPDSKKSNGQPSLDFAKRAQRTINEARATLQETKP